MAAARHQGLHRGRVPGESHAPRSGRAVYEITAVQPCSRERLLDVPAFAAHGLGDFCRSHPFFTQGDDAGTVESGGTALVNPLRLCGLDAGALPIADEAKLHLGDHAAHRPAGIDGMVAEMELGFIRDRQRTGIEAAKAKGIYKGRPATFDRAHIVSLRKEGMGATEIAEAVGCNRGNVCKALKAVVPSALIAPNLIPRRRSQDASARQCDVGS